MIVKYVNVIIGLLIIGGIMLAAYAINQDIQLTEEAHRAGCNYLGTARDLRMVRFYECNGQVVMKLKQ